MNLAAFIATDAAARVELVRADARGAHEALVALGDECERLAAGSPAEALAQGRAIAECARSLRLGSAAARALRATIAALEGLGDLNTDTQPRLILLAGGDGKGQDFAPLAPPVKRHAKAVMLIGRDGPSLREALSGTGVPLTDCWTLEQAVERAAEIAKGGDIVLLSPACASFDMFTHYAHRAEVFINAVRELGLSRGEVSA